MEKASHPSQTGASRDSARRPAVRGNGARHSEPTMATFVSVVGNRAMTQMVARRSAPLAQPSRAYHPHFRVPAGASASPPVSRQALGSACIQRHSAFEHYLLGQVAPNKLAEIPQVREIPSLQQQLADLKAQIKKAQVIKGSDMGKIDKAAKGK